MADGTDSEDAPVAEMERVIVVGEEVNQAQSIGSLFDFGYTSRGIQQYYVSHYRELQSEERFIATVNHAAGAYSAVGVGVIATGETLAGTSVAAGPPDIQNGLRIADLILQLILGRRGPTPVNPLPRPPGPVAEGPVIPGG